MRIGITDAPAFCNTRPGLSKTFKLSSSDLTPVENHTTLPSRIAFIKALAAKAFVASIAITSAKRSIIFHQNLLEVCGDKATVTRSGKKQQVKASQLLTFYWQ